MDSGTDKLRVDVDGGIGLLTFDDPATRNSLSDEVRAALPAALAALATDDGVRVGAVMVVHERQAPLVDPDTGLNLGAPERLVGELEVVSVEPRFSVARPRSGAGFARGQVARPAEGR